MPRVREQVASHVLRIRLRSRRVLPQVVAVVRHRHLRHHGHWEVRVVPLIETHLLHLMLQLLLQHLRYIWSFGIDRVHRIAWNDACNVNFNSLELPFIVMCCGRWLPTSGGGSIGIPGWPATFGNEIGICRLWSAACWLICLTEDYSLRLQRRSLRSFCASQLLLELEPAGTLCWFAGSGPSERAC